MIVNIGIDDAAWRLVMEAIDAYIDNQHVFYATDEAEADTMLLIHIRLVIAEALDQTAKGERGTDTVPIKKAGA